MRVVLVDPSRTVLKWVTRLLEARDHEVMTFTDGLEALACIKADERISALITSAAPHSISGVELCCEVRLTATHRRPIYVLMMSSNQDWRSVIEALDCGADDFIPKPPVPEELYARLRVAERLDTMQRELILLATTDPLTSVFNRRAFFEQANEACAVARDGAALAAIMVDVDHFKAVNDKFGHSVGDTVLRDVAQATAGAGRLVGRLGGEEFALMLDGCTAAQGVAAADQLRIAIEALRWDAVGGPIKVTCSFGVSEWQPGDTIDQILKRADVALFEAKAHGRNRVVVARTELLASAAAA